MSHHPSSTTKGIVMTETENEVNIAELLRNILKARSVAMTIAYEGPHIELYRYAADGYDYGILSFFRMLQDRNGDALFHVRGRIAIASAPDEGEERNEELLTQLNEQLSVLQIEAMMIETQIELLESNETTIEKIGGSSLFLHMKTTRIMRALKKTSVDELVKVLSDSL